VPLLTQPRSHSTPPARPRSRTCGERSTSELLADLGLGHTSPTAAALGAAGGAPAEASSGSVSGLLAPAGPWSSAAEHHTFPGSLPGHVNEQFSPESQRPLQRMPKAVGAKAYAVGEHVYVTQSSLENRSAALRCTAANRGSVVPGTIAAAGSSAWTAS
jgi:hypothetical protein